MLDFDSLTVSNKCMFKKCIVLILALWPWHNAFAVPYTPFEFFNAQREKEKDICSETAVAGMPPERSQDSLPICSAFSSAAIVQFQVCKKIPGACVDGKPKTMKTTVSPLSMVSWMRTNTGIGVAGNSSNFRSLQFYAGSAGASDALSNASFGPVFVAESCYPFDQLVNEHGLENFDKVQGLVKVIENEYTKASTEGDGLCEDCLKGAAFEGAAKQLGISAGNIAGAITNAKAEKETSGQFLRDLMLGQCEDTIKFRPSQAPKFEVFPKVAGDFSYEKWIGKVKEVLSSGNPLAFDGICLEYDGPKCKTEHSVAISGYRKVCKKDPQTLDQKVCKVSCRDVVKIHNSWGKDWQSKIAGDVGGDGEGWVDAIKLTEYVTKNKSKNKENFISIPFKRIKLILKCNYPNRHPTNNLT